MKGSHSPRVSANNWLVIGPLINSDQAESACGPRSIGGTERRRLAVRRIASQPALIDELARPPDTVGPLKCWARLAGRSQEPFENE